jgi:hypothetical protein
VKLRNRDDGGYTGDYYFDDDHYDDGGYTGDYYFDDDHYDDGRYEMRVSPMMSLTISPRMLQSRCKIAQY